MGSAKAGTVRSASPTTAERIEALFKKNHLKGVLKYESFYAHLPCDAHIPPLSYFIEANNVITMFTPSKRLLSRKVRLFPAPAWHLNTIATRSFSSAASNR